MESYVFSFDDPSDESMYLDVIVDEQKVADIKAIYNCLEILKSEVERLIYEYQLKGEVEQLQWMYLTLSGLKKIQKDIRMEKEKLKDPQYFPQMEANLNESSEDKNENNYIKDKITEELLNKNENSLDTFFKTDWGKLSLEDIVKDSFGSSDSSTHKNLHDSGNDDFLIKNSKEAQMKEVQVLVSQFDKEVAKYRKISDGQKKREQAAVTILKLKHESEKNNLNKAISKLQNEISILRRQSILPVRYCEFQNVQRKKIEKQF